MPAGLFTAQGVWFHTTLKDLETFAAPVLERVRLERLLRDAAAWLRSPGTLALWAALAALMMRSVSTAATLGLVAWIGWRVLAPGLVLRPLVRLASWLEFPLLIGGAYVAGLSWLASSGAMASVAFGLLWFVLVRWGVLERVLSPLLSPVVRRLYRLPAADQILRALIVRHALALRVAVGDLEAMERRMIEIGTRHKHS